MLDVFNNDAFQVVPLTDAINSLQFVPGRVGELGMFSPSSVATTSIAIEEKKNQLVLVPPTPRGAPGTTTDKTKRKIRNLSIPHFEINDAIMAEEVQGVRAWGSETETETVQGKVAERGIEHSQSFAATDEFAMLGAVKGVITYADGSETNLFTEFNVTKLDDIDFDIANAADGALRKTCADVYRQISEELGGIPMSGVRAFVGKDFMDALLQNGEVRDTYKGYSAAKILREGYIDPNGKRYSAFEFGDIVFEEYRGTVSGTQFVEDDACHMFPTGVPALFRKYYAPADYIETVNTPGQRLYAKIWEMPNGKGVNFDVQMNALNICTRPRTLVKGLL